MQPQKLEPHQNIPAISKNGQTERLPGYHNEAGPRTLRLVVRPLLLEGRILDTAAWSLASPFTPVKSVKLVIERLRVRILAGAAEEFSSPELSLCADSYSVSVPPPCYHRGT